MKHKNKYVTVSDYAKVRLRSPFRERFVPALAFTKATKGKIIKKWYASIRRKLSTDVRYCIGNYLDFKQ